MRIRKQSFALFSRQLHASIAYLLALILIWFTLSGWFLHHTEDFKLNDIKLNQTWLLKWYDIPIPNIEQAYPISNENKHSVNAVKTNQALYLASIKLALNEPIKAVYSSESFSFIVLNTALIISTHQGNIVEVLPLPYDFADTLENNVSNLRLYSLEDNQFVWSLGDACWLLTSDLAQIKKYSLTDFDRNGRIHSLEPLSQNAINALDPMAFFESPLTLEALVLDLHNGYFLGGIGKWLVDVSAVLILMMILSGLSIKIRKKRNRSH